jgi:alcohol dehydrogenase (NADP+)
LSEEEINKIDGVDRKLRFNDPSKFFGHNFFADLDGKEAASI